MNVKRDFVVLDYINLLLMLLCCMLPWIFAEKYNPDLLMYFGAKESILKQGLLKSIINNRVLFYLFFFVFGKINFVNIIFCFHNLIVISFFLIARKLLNPIFLLSFVLFLFFSVFCNQYRSLIPILIFIYIILKNETNIFILLPLFIISFFSHNFTFVFCFIFYVYNTCKIKYFFLLLFLIILSFIILKNIEKRYFFYFSKDYLSLMSLSTIIILGVLGRFISLKNKIFLTILFILSAFLAVFGSISSRLSELVILFIFLSVMISENDFPNWDKHKVQIVFLILFSFSFFIYRFTVITYFKQNSVLFFNYLFNFVKMVICRCISY